LESKSLPLECVVRGYLAGSGRKGHQQPQSVCGIALPARLKGIGGASNERRASRLRYAFLATRIDTVSNA
jgi:hypothetical protein